MPPSTFSDYMKYEFYKFCLCPSKLKFDKKQTIDTKVRALQIFLKTLVSPSFFMDITII